MWDRAHARSHMGVLAWDAQVRIPDGVGIAHMRNAHGMRDSGSFGLVMRMCAMQDRLNPFVVVGCRFWASKGTGSSRDVVDIDVVIYF